METKRGATNGIIPTCTSHADNNSKCSTEFVRWITTHGREGRWITDVSPYLFMLQDDHI